MSALRRLDENTPVPVKILAPIALGVWFLHSQLSDLSVRIARIEMKLGIPSAVAER